MATDPDVAASVVEGILSAGIPVLVAQPGTVVAESADANDVRIVPEGFPDRGYQADGRLADRGEPGALFDDPDETARRAVSMVERCGVEAVDGTWVRFGTETLCIHGDSPAAAETARRVRSALQAAGIALRPFNR
jgi:UPF0271 protein